MGRVREALLARAIQAVGREDPVQLAAGDDPIERAVHRREQILVGGADADRVLPLAQIAGHAQRRMPGFVAIDDDVVQQHRGGPPVLEVDERLVDAFVGDRHRARAEQHVPPLRARERADTLPAQRREIAQPCLVFRAGHQPLGEQKVRA